MTPLSTVMAVTALLALVCSAYAAVGVDVSASVSTYVLPASRQHSISPIFSISASQHSREARYLQFVAVPGVQKACGRMLHSAPSLPPPPRLPATPLPFPNLSCAPTAHLSNACATMDTARSPSREYVFVRREWRETEPLELSNAAIIAPATRPGPPDPLCNLNLARPE